MEQKIDKPEYVEMNDNEKRTLLDYFSSGSYRINEKLREKIDLDDEEKVYVGTLGGILKKTPRIDGEDLVRDLFFYSEESIEKFASMFNVGESYKTDQFWSTTTHESYNDWANVRIIIKNAKLARDVRPLEKKNEGEVIYEIGSEFVVTTKERSKNECGDDMVLIQLVEKGS